MKNFVSLLDVEMFLIKGWHYRAALEVAQYLNYNGSIFNKPQVISVCDKVDWIEVEIGAIAKIEQAISILPYGSEWDEDEILVIFSIVLDIQLITQLTDLLNLGFKFKITEIKRLLKLVNQKNKKNKRAINSAAIMLDKNSELKSWRSIVEFESLFD